jgi:chemotaxis protein CheD
MRAERHRGGQRVTIEPGEHYATRGPEVISTLLGSCVAACLYDPIGSVIGMNHFMLSHTRYSRTLPIHASEAGRYGIFAMEFLLNAMVAKGAERRRLRAKVFGGGNVLNTESDGSNFFCVGSVNCSFIREFLVNESIPIDAEDLGGDFGRVIHFSNGSYSVHRRKVGTSTSLKVGHRDREIWQRAIEQQEKAVTSIDLW